MIRKDKHICNGEPRLAGTRLTVGFILRELAAVQGNFDDAIRSYPTLTRKGISEVLYWAGKHIPIKS